MNVYYLGTKPSFPSPLDLLLPFSDPPKPRLAEKNQISARKSGIVMRLKDQVG